MAIITPHRPIVASPPQEQPHVVSGGAGAITVDGYDAVVSTPTTSDREIIMEGDWPSNYASLYNWDFGPALGDDMTVSHSTHTGAYGTNDSITITWLDAATPSDKFGSYFTIDGINSTTDTEVWFTYEMMFSDPFSTGGTSNGGKLPGLRGSTAGNGCVQPVPADGSSWAHRIMWNSLKPNNEVGGHLYMYHPDKTNSCGQRVDFTGGWFPKGQWFEVELHMKSNTGASNFDGIWECKIDGTLVRSRTNLRYFGSGGSLSNTPPAKVNWQLFYGGSGSSWSPQFDSSISFAYWKIERPA